MLFGTNCRSSTPQKAAARLLTSHLTNHPSKTNKASRPSHGLSNITADFLQGWHWHYITHEVWYAYKQRNWIKIKHAGLCKWSKGKFISNVFLLTPIKRCASVGLPVRTYIHQFCVDTGCCQENLAEEKDSKRESETERERERERESRNYKNDLIIYIYIYIHPLDKWVERLLTAQ